MDNKLSFTQFVKEELTKNEYSFLPKLKAVLSAYIRIVSSIVIVQNKTQLVINTLNASIAKFIYSHLCELYNCKGHLDFIKKPKKLNYQITILEKTEEILNDLKVDFFEGKVSRDLVYNDQTISGYLAGVFLASGSVNSPHSSNYHLEISLNNENYAMWVEKLFPRYRGAKIEPKMIKRRDKYVIYFKKSDQIANFLAMIGANESCVEYENIRIDRDFVNTTNRLTNFDTANMQRTVKTAQRQKEEILAIEEKYGITFFKNHKCALLCELRKEYESYSLDDLAKKMTEITGEKITKSNVNHLFRHIHQIYIEKVGK